MKIAVLSANLGGYERHVDWPTLDAPSGVTVDVHRFTDRDLPPRPKAMTSRLMAGLPKWFGYELRPGYDAYLWIDASCVPSQDSIRWWLDQLCFYGAWPIDGTRADAWLLADIVVFRHPDRRTIAEEYRFVATRLQDPRERYLHSRYEGEWLDEQYGIIAADTFYHDDVLYASTAFMYQPTPRVQRAFTEMWIAKTRWLLHDQLWFPYALDRHHVTTNVIDEQYLKCPALTYVRNRSSVSRA